MSAPRFDVTPFLDQEEGQHFDRKSLFAGEPGKKTPRERRQVRDHVAEYVAGFARLNPPQPRGFLVEHGGATLLVFDTPPAPYRPELVADRPEPARDRPNAAPYRPESPVAVASLCARPRVPEAA